MKRRRSARPLAALGLVLGLVGCTDGGDGLPRVAVTGRVTIAGEPLAKGAVTFRPDGDGAEASGEVVGGTFTIPAADGPTPGKYKVSATETIERAESEKLNGFTLQPQTKPSRTTIGGPLEAEVKAGSENSLSLDFPRVDASKGSKGQAR